MAKSSWTCPRKLAVSPKFERAQSIDFQKLVRTVAEQTNSELQFESVSKTHERPFTWSILDLNILTETKPTHDHTAFGALQQCANLIVVYSASSD